MLNAKETVHWENDGKLLCDTSLDVDDDRYLLTSMCGTKWVNCKRCIELAEAARKPMCK